MPILQIILSLVMSNLRPLILAFLAIFSCGSIYFGIASHFEKKAVAKIIKQQARELDISRKRCNRLTANYLANSNRHNLELINVQSKINNEQKISAWGGQPLPSDVERMLND